MTAYHDEHENELGRQSAPITPDMLAMDEKGLKAAHVAYERFGQEGDLRTRRISDDCMSAVIAAYLAATAREEDAVGEAGTMPGTDGFTMACFKAVDVPVGTKLYVRASLKASQDDLAKQKIIEFAQAILHGDDEHRGWLMGAALAFNAGDALPAPRGKGTSIQASQEAEGDGPEEIEIDRLRIAAFKSNSPADRDAYFKAASKWFQDRHYRRLANPQPAPDTEGRKL